jgi:SAM-dependent methyltransferase
VTAERDGSTTADALAPGFPANLRVVSSLKVADPAYSVTDVEAMRALRHAEDQHFWFRARNHFIAARLGRLGVGSGSAILDLGCGAGCVSAHLARLGYRLTGVEGHLPLARVAAARAPSASFIVYDLASGMDSLGMGQFDAVALFDVIEHMDDPRRTLEGALKLARPGGWVVGTVPALMRLWTEVDRLSGHRLRFEEEELTGLLHTVPGASRVEVVPFNRLLVPLLALQRKRVSRDPSRSLTENFRIPWLPVNVGLVAALWLERLASGLLARTTLPGASLWFAFRREGG